ncbi:KPN_02809 family neutral zinc metallopeptidase [Thiolapillus sp.]
MKWRGRRRSTNVEDRRGMRVGKAGGIGIGTIILALVAMYFGVDPRLVMDVGSQLGGGQIATQQADYQPTEADREKGEFVAVVLADTEDVWNQEFQKYGKRYAEPKLVLFSGAVQSACGMAQAAVGPFYCPGDHKVYIDLVFYDELQRRFQAPGDLAQAYVIAHEVGHHVQNLLGYTKQVPRGSKGADSAAVRLELQADCFAGIWVNHTQKAKNFLQSGDLDEALNAASAIGDDRMQRQATGTVRPDGFTHGTSAQRQRWFRKGVNNGRLEDCDTFRATTL